MQYGSSLISKIKFRDNFIMIGQKGLAQGSAIEQVLFSMSSALYVCLCDSECSVSPHVKLPCV